LRFTLQEKGGERRSFRAGHAIVKAKISRDELAAKLEVVETSLPDDDEDEVSDSTSYSTTQRLSLVKSTEAFPARDDRHSLSPPVGT
jgi:hypothetical protein